MTDESALQSAFCAMDAAPQDDDLRLAFYDVLARSEVLLLLERETKGATLDPRIVETGEGRFAIAFDTEARLAGFCGGPAPYAALPGRALAAMLGAERLGLVLNPDGMAALLPARAMIWLSETLARRPSRRDDQIAEVLPPEPLPEGFLEVLDRRLAEAQGMAGAAVLASARFRDGTLGNLIAVLDAVPEATDALAASINEALVFADAGQTWDIAFIGAETGVARALMRRGLCIDFPVLEEPAPATPKRDPSRPPILR